MISRSNYPILIFLFVCLTFAANAQLDSLYTQQWGRDAVTNFNSTNSSQRQIITKETIRNSGYTHLSDVLYLIDGWTASTLTDGNSSMQSNGTGSYNQQNWVVMLNGQRIELDRSFPQSLNQLAIGIYDIERIEVINSNGMFLGEYTQYGLIHIITKKQTVNGIHADAFLSSAAGYDVYNGELDGGFYLRDMRAVSLGYTKNNFNINTSVLYQNVGSSSTSNNLISRVELQYTGKKISHQIQTQSILKGQNPPYRLASYLGLWNINTHNQIRLSTTFTNTKYEWGDPQAQQFKNTLQHRYLKTYKKGNFIWQNGLGYDYIKYNSTSMSGSVQNATIIKPYTSINIPITRKANLFGDAQVAFCNGKTAPKVSVGVYKKVSFISNYSFVFGYTETLLEEAFLTSVNKDINAMETASNFYSPKLTTADFYYNINIGNNAKFSFNSGLKNAYDVPDYQYSASTNNQVVSTYQLNWINRFNIHYDIIKNVVFDINYMHTRRLNSWDDNLQNIPKHKFTFTLQYDLPKRFTLWSRNYMQSKTQWFTDYGNSSAGLYYTQPTQFGWDIGLNKKLFKEYLNINLAARNVLQKDIYYSSSGMFEFLGGIFISITANINGIGETKTPKP